MARRAKAFAQHAPVVVNQTYSLAADMVSGNFFIADRDYELAEVSVSWDVPSSSGTLQIQRLQGTEAPGAGDDLLTATVDLSAADDTVTRPALTTTTADLRLNRGDRLAAEWAGTVTNGVAATVNCVLIPTGAFRDY